MLSQLLGCAFHGTSVNMGSVEVPAQGNDVIKIPTSNYEFGANFINEKVVLICL